MIPIPNLSRYLMTDDGLIYDQWRDIYKLTHINNCGYEIIGLQNDDGEFSTHHVGRLLAQTYLPNPDNKPQVDHKDRNRLNNQLSNLRWVTVSENQQNHKIRKDNKLQVKFIGMNKGMYVYKRTIEGKKYKKWSKTLPQACFEEYIHSRLLQINS